jgi:hypothetical protein
MHAFSCWSGSCQTELMKLRPLLCLLFVLIPGLVLPQTAVATAKGGQHAAPTWTAATSPYTLRQ